MTLLLSDESLRRRRAVVAGPLSALTASLAAELKPLLEVAEIHVPREKALLSRAGGRCPRHGVYLEFDPFSPHEHRCPEGDGAFHGEPHDRFWIYWYQLWLAERSVQAALLATLLADDELAGLAGRILDRYAGLYLGYPNRDNVLGPTRLFFSTYLESIWLLNICIATDLLEGHHRRFGELGQRVRDRIVQPSLEIIASYDEGASNRQVWNDAAMLAAGRLLDRPDSRERALFGSAGIVYHLQNGLLADGTWYEGENYHLFAHRGLWYAVTMAEAAGIALPIDLLARFDKGFVTPFLTALPDMTLPSRRDSQYAISLRQPRFAELAELGIARRSECPDARLVSVLRLLYDADVPRRDTGRSRSTADVERNLPGTRLTRADLGWRSLLFALPELPEPSESDGVTLSSELLPEQGIAVFRRAGGRVYAALDYGLSGGGHGHPDRLNVLLSDGSTRWLDDMGTGSYVDPSLHWYRSTLAHNAPLFDGYQQQRVDGELLAYDERGHSGWISARADHLLPGVAAARSLVVMADYLLDELVWHARTSVVMDLPLHVDAIGPALAESLLGEAAALRDTLGALEDVTGGWIPAHTPMCVEARDGQRVLHGFLISSHIALLYRATAPGPPGMGRRPMILARVLGALERGGTAWLRTVWCWNDAVERVSVRPDAATTTVHFRDGSRDQHRLTSGGWRIRRRVGDLRTEIELGGRPSRRTPSRKPRAPDPPPRASYSLRRGHPFSMELGETDYRRSEETWTEAGGPAARVAMLLAGDELVIDVRVRKAGEPTFVSPDSENPYDNEAADVNGDGIQLYLEDQNGASGFMLVPQRTGEQDGSIHARVIDGWDSCHALRGIWTRESDGYSIRLRLAAPHVSPDEHVFHLGLVVNEKPAGRARRRGQLVLGGARSEFVYLRGDREDHSRLVQFRVAD